MKDEQDAVNYVIEIQISRQIAGIDRKFSPTVRVTQEVLLVQEGNAEGKLVPGKEACCRVLKL